MSTKVEQKLKQQLWDLRDEYLKDLEKYSFDNKKQLAPMFQNGASYQEIATKHFLEFALKRIKLTNKP